MKPESGAPLLSPSCVEPEDLSQYVIWSSYQHVHDIAEPVEMIFVYDRMTYIITVLSV